MKINQAFLHGFMTQDRATAPLTVTGDDEELILRKGEGFDEWIKDTTGIINTQDLGHEVPYNEMNISVLNAIVRNWLHGEEFEG